MIRKFTVCLMICLIGLLIGSFSEEALSPPAKTSCTAANAGGAVSSFAFVTTNTGFAKALAVKNEYANTGSQSVVLSDELLNGKNV